MSGRRHTPGVFGGGRAARELAMRRRAAAITATAQPSSLFVGILGPTCLEIVVLKCEREDAESLRATCRALRAVTLSPGFGTLWRQAHPAEVKAKRMLSAMRQHFSQLDDEPLEAEVQNGAVGHRWERILPPRPAPRTTERAPSPQTGSASSSASPPAPPRTAVTISKRRDEAREGSITDLQRLYADVDQHELETEIVVTRAECER